MKMIYGIPTTKKEKLLMKMNKLENEITSIVYRGAKWIVNMDTGETECVKPELSDKETQQVENLKAELKQLEVEIKLIEMGEDFDSMENE